MAMHADSEAPSTTSPDPVFVDLDRCLLLDDSIGGFLAHLVDRGLAPPTAMLRGAFAYLSYRMNWIDPGAMIHRGIRGMAGFSEADLQREALTFYRNHVRYRYRISLLDVLDQHRQAGRPIWILTGGLPYVPNLIADELDLTGACSTVAEVEDGYFTGRIKAPPCVGAGKIVHAQRAASSRNLTLDRTWFYTDSYSDLPMLEVARQPVAVNPDRKLRKLARRRDWPILY